MGRERFASQSLLQLDSHQYSEVRPASYASIDCM
ncbi:hypothetical protein XVE_0826 [Xanthomonas vesicatoria ATCC 35937]|uniref:Uncharacterized protein n=1 Tax=Xanthomonas vesicatoria ATCC 35937 TaxID=925775 RepID=F0B9S2_9XANT|nr:hypothetical protein XVE_0826 [Xanthomonas vesicatoria ATCC 35937]